MRLRQFHMTAEQRKNAADAIRLLRKSGLIRSAAERHAMSRLAKERIDAYTEALNLISDRTPSRIHKLLNLLECRGLMRMKRRGDI